MNKTPRRSPSHWAFIEPRLAEAARRSKKGAWSPRTFEAHRQAAFLLDELEPSTLTQAELDQLRASALKRYKLNAGRSQLGRIRTILRRAYGRDDLVLRVPAGRPAEVLPLSPEQTAKLFDALRRRPDAYAALLLEYESALRPGEVIGLDLKDVNLEARQVLLRDGKTGMRAANLSTEAVAALQRWLAVRKPASGHEEALFVNQYGKRPSISHFLGKAMKQAAAEAGIAQRVYPNLLRAGIATHLMNRNVNPRVVQALMGHRDLRTTMVYNRVSPDETRRILDHEWKQLRGIEAKAPRDLAKEIGEGLATGELSLSQVKGLLAALDSLPKGPVEPGSGYA